MGPTLLTGEIAAISVLESLAIIGEDRAKHERERLWDEIFQIERSFVKNVVDARLSLMRTFFEKHGGKPPKMLVNY